MAGLRVKVDTMHKNPGYKYAHWELRGVPLRVELGPKDMENKTVRLCRRDTGGKIDVSWEDLVPKAQEVLQTIHDNLYDRAKRTMDENIIRVTEWNQMIDALAAGKLVLAPHSNETADEDELSDRTKKHFDAADQDERALSGKAKALCIP